MCWSVTSKLPRPKHCYTTLDHVVVIPGSKRIKVLYILLCTGEASHIYNSQYMEENWGASTVQLTPGEVAAVRKVSEDAGLIGNRYAEYHMSLVQKPTPPL